MKQIFVSHAVADKALADKFVAFLKEAIGAPARSIFCSSIDGHNIPLGYDFNNYMKEQIQRPQLVILLMTPRYMESWFCLMELGATWAKSLNALPIVVPPIKFDAVSSTLGLKQGWSINKHSKLIDLRKMVQDINIPLEERSEHDWDKKRDAWKVDLKRLLKNLPPPTNVSASEHVLIQDELAKLKQELASLQGSYKEANETIAELKAAKNSDAVKAIMAKKTAFDAKSQFDELLKNIADHRPNVGVVFYRNLIMDLYGKTASIEWLDRDQKSDAERAIQYNIMEPEQPHAYLWTGKRLKKVLAAVKALEEFLESDEAEDFVNECESKGHTMDIEDLEFWEDNLT